ncbi:MAG: helix-turn-helix domain-containing protein [Tannerella sp.]|jgi:AraC-like DNA-binding protein|nr:helix-turn-helix domain-containing protein [Tannerella sp.]
MNNFVEAMRELGSTQSTCEIYNNELLTLSFDSVAVDALRSIKPLAPARYNAFVLVGITQGSLQIQIDYVNYVAQNNTIVMIMPSHITSFIKGSSDIKGWVLSVSASYMETFSSQSRTPTILSYMQLKKNPVTTFDAKDYSELCESFDFLRNKITQRNHVFYDDLINVAVKLFFIELGNIYIGQSVDFTTETFSRQEELFFEFQKLLMEHCTTHHDVAFYADKLCITTQYLSLILNEQSGKSASQWIQEALVVEAKSLLKPRTSIQEVADALNFPDASTFGKFFKKNTGVSPLTFKKSQR